MAVEGFRGNPAKEVFAQRSHRVIGIFRLVETTGQLDIPGVFLVCWTCPFSRFAPASDLAPTQPLAAVTVRPRRRAAAFWLLWTGQTISALGSSFTQFALPLLVYKLTGSALTLGLATAAEVLPYLLFGLPIGAWVDRLPRQRLLLVITVLQAGTLAVIPGLFVLGALSVWWLYGLAFVSTILKLGSETCQIALMPGLVEAARLTDANGRLQTGTSAAQLLGPMLAGTLVLLVPLPLLLLVDVASFVLAAALFAGLQVRFRQEATPTRQPLRQAMGEGLRYVWRDPILRAISLLTPLVNGVSIVAVAQLVLFARVHYHASASAISLLYAATSGGYLLVGLLAGPLRRRCSFPMTTLGALVLMGVLIGLMGVTPWYWLGVVLWGLSQGAEMLFTLHARSYRQERVPPALLGRVMSVAYVLAYSTSPVGALAGGLVIAWLGPGQIAWVYAGLGGLIVLLALSFAGTALGRAGRAATSAAPVPVVPTPLPAAAKERRTVASSAVRQGGVYGHS